MRVLVIDPCRDGGAGALDFAWRATEAGHKVKFFQDRTPHNEFVGKGLVDRVDDFGKWLLWADLILNVDNTKYLDIMARARKDGQSVISATKESAAWEIDREKGMQVLKQYGINVPEYRVFRSAAEGIAFIKQTMGRYVSKPVGDGDADRALSYCSKGPADLIFMLERWQKLGRIKPYMLQKFASGIEFAVGVFVGPNGYASNWCENFEHKKLMPGDIGINTGETGTVLKFTEKSKLASKTIKKFEEEIVKTGHIGYLDLNCIIDEFGDIHPLEWTCRNGWPTFNIQSNFFEGDPVEWLKTLADGGKPPPFGTANTAVGAVLFIPDFPYSSLTGREVCGFPIRGLEGDMLEWFHICSVMKDNVPVEEGDAIVTKEMMCSAGDYIGVAVGVGDTVTGAREKLYRRLDRLDVSGKMYRNDIGCRLRRQLPELQRLGYATSFKYN